MAISLSKELSTGQVVSYHKIVKIHIDRNHGSFIVDVASFKDKDARETEKAQDDYNSYEVNSLISCLTTQCPNLIAACYESLKALPEFKGAEDA